MRPKTPSRDSLSSRYSTRRTACALRWLAASAVVAVALPATAQDLVVTAANPARCDDGVVTLPPSAASAGDEASGAHFLIDTAGAVHEVAGASPDVPDGAANEVRVALSNPPAGEKFRDAQITALVLLIDEIGSDARVRAAWAALECASGPTDLAAFDWTTFEERRALLAR